VHFRTLIRSDIDSCNVRFLRADHIPGSGPSIYHRVYIGPCDCILVRKIPRIMLPHYRADCARCNRNSGAYIDPERGWSLFWHDSPNQWDLFGPQSSAVVGDDACALATKQKGRLDCHCQLYQPNQSLVQPLLLPHVTGAVLSYGRWFNPVRVHMHCVVVLGN
jgi:hypothetical protein